MSREGVGEEGGTGRVETGVDEEERGCGRREGRCVSRDVAGEKTGG